MDLKDIDPMLDSIDLTDRLTPILPILNILPLGSIFITGLLPA
jgi:hypothetical protein